MGILLHCPSYTPCAETIFSLGPFFPIFPRTSIIMASGRELSYVLLFGILSSYACTFVILAHPGFTICISTRTHISQTGIKEFKYYFFEFNSVEAWPWRVPVRVLLRHLHQDEPNLPYLPRLHEGEPEVQLHIAKVPASHLLR